MLAMSSVRRAAQLSPVKAPPAGSDLQRLAQRDARCHPAARCGVRYSDKLGATFRGAPIDADALRHSHHSRNQQRMFLNVDLLATGKPASSCSAKHAAAENRRINCRRVSDDRSAPPWSVAIAIAMSRYLRATVVRPSILAKKQAHW